MSDETTTLTAIGTLICAIKSAASVEHRYDTEEGKYQRVQFDDKAICGAADEFIRVTKILAAISELENKTAQLRRTI